MYLSMSVQDASIAKLWELEAIGVEDPSKECSEKKKLELEIEKFMENISRNPDGRYVVKLPWKNNLSFLPSNRPVAFKRLQSVSKKLADGGSFDSYNSIFMEWEKEDFIERVSIECEAEIIHYVPHRPVIKESLTTPVRPVFDASCRVGKSPSLNDCLFTGENKVKAIPDLLQRFREKSVAFVSDIRKAFQMISVDTSDRDAMRFLWWEDDKMTKLVEFRHARVMFGATCSPFILEAVLRCHLTRLSEAERELGERLLRSLYVDNCVSSEDSEEGYKTFRRKATELLNRAKMDLRMWMSNVDEFEDVNTHIVSVLGVQWDRVKDELFVAVKKVSVPTKITKRSVLSAVQKIFDPIGFTSPAVLPMKLLLQRVWINKLKWDDELPENERRTFMRWCEEIEDLGIVRIPRLSTAGVIDRDKWSLHTFTDASKEAYSAVVFLRVQTDSSVHVQLLAAKSRVAPIKPLTIPKLELMGCLIGKRLAASVKKALSFDEGKEHYWSDSTTALAWIRKDPDLWGTFVSNRTKEIREGIGSEVWRHVPGVVNPADLPSRGCFPSSLLASMWWNGPDWLYKEENCWPTRNEEYDEKEVLSEKRKSVTVPVDLNSLTVFDCLGEKHSFGKRVRILGWVRRFLHNKFVKNSEKRKTGPLDKTELSRAEILLIRDIQRVSFPREERNKLKGLVTYEDDWGVLRVKTKLTYRNDPINFKFPMLLPRKGEVVEQIIRDAHRHYCHAGAGFLTTKLRQKYWIIKARHSIKRVISKCPRCRRYSAKPTIPEAAPLPLDRVKDAEVFEVVGVDLAGPLILRNGKKVWMVIFTCAVYRAVHFELVCAVSTQAFINALERFVEKYRRPSIIYSDNGTNFRGADNLFKKIDWKTIKKDDKTSRIVWKFNPPTSSWWGGWWERLIRTAKELLKRTVGKQSLSIHELKDVLKTITEVMNGRPLTYVSDDPADLEPLTPALFLNPLGSVDFPETKANDAEKLRMRYKYVTTLKREIKQRFLKEYLSMLVDRNPKKVTRGLMVGELVFVGFDNLKRIEWPLGKIIELIPGRDGVVRVARVKTERGEMTRSVQRLYPLEATDQPKESIQDDEPIVTRTGRRIRKPLRFK
ncbi:unnamed protein product [Orchesella dallaii]|uniref:Integrase catalytic domain-containing protein n=1 Tax=Orchesella dallaii TaxID=48710 RepID=A0ABP1R796_9HEXA